MEIQKQVHKNFIRSKYAEELQYAIKQHQIYLKSLEKELNFYEFLLDSCKFKSPIMNLFERLTQFKIDIATSNKNRALLLSEINAITFKRSNASLKNIDLIITKLEKIEAKIHNFNTDISRLKSSMFEYLQNVIAS
ncbi:hypothetical protein GCM10023311_03600 [Flaviramulus aquimarinus]|uniref:Uncharacterized protein n=1 Tax=Flaviramulus aquimarinus TaxID=1170456 RepID=A0ABP9ERV5_9FLAO